MPKRKTGTPGRDRTKYAATPKRHQGPRPPRRLGLLPLLVALAFGGLVLTGAVKWTPQNLDHLAATAGWTGAKGELHVQDCTRHRSAKGSVSYSCSGPVAPREAAPGAFRGVVWILGEEGDVHGRTLAVDCPPEGDICVRTGTHAVLEAVLLLYFMAALYLLGAAVVLAAVRHRRPALFGWCLRRRARLRKAAGWAAAVAGLSLAAVLIGVAAT
ncbi:hypothetical protein ABT095_08215 [Kitasatospora sp. NPDC002227]|uniref:hypothetical protein n=1 Tax=Kitasatospora sp. NPDC002227 TaxID=3154773 RepID=UPI003330554D